MMRATQTLKKRKIAPQHNVQSSLSNLTDQINNSSGGLSRLHQTITKLESEHHNAKRLKMQKARAPASRRRVVQCKSKAKCENKMETQQVLQLRVEELEALVSEQKCVIQDQKFVIDELKEEPQDSKGYLYLMSVEPLADSTTMYPFDAAVFPPGHKVWKISVTGNDSVSVASHQTNCPHKLVLEYRSNIKFAEYRECKKLCKESFKQKTLGGTDWFIADPSEVKREIDSLIDKVYGIKLICC
jgi:hypothetical protein